MSYFVMAKQFDAFNNPDIARYDNDKWVVSGVAPIDFGGYIVDLSEREELDELVSIIDRMAKPEPQGFLLIIPEWFGQWLYNNHPAFKPKQGDGDGTSS